MKNSWIVRYGVFLVVLLSACGTPEPTATPAPTATPVPEPFTLTVLYTNDGWGYTEPCACDPSAGGLARRAAYIRSVREQVEDVLLVDAGDSLMTLQRLGDLEQGRILVEAFNEMGYDAVDKGEAQFLLVMNPTRMEQVRDCTTVGEKMPQKSTDFYPKVISGLVMMPIGVDKRL